MFVVWALFVTALQKTQLVYIFFLASNSHQKSDPPLFRCKRKTTERGACGRISTPRRLTMQADGGHKDITEPTECDKAVSSTFANGTSLKVLLNSSVR